MNTRSGRSLIDQFVDPGCRTKQRVGPLRTRTGNSSHRTGVHQQLRTPRGRAFTVENEPITHEVTEDEAVPSRDPFRVRYTIQPDEAVIAMTLDEDPAADDVDW